MTRFFHRDRKLQRWQIFEPHGDERRWTALCYRYDPRAPVVLYASTREGVVAELEKFSASHGVHLNRDDAGQIAVYGLFSIVVGGGAAVAASVLGFPRVSRAAGYKALFGAGALAAGLALDAKIAHAPDPAQGA